MEKDIKTKKCTKCGEEKELSGFSKDKNNKDGFSSQCKKCVSDYYKKNREKIMASQKAYREANGENLAKRQKAYSEKGIKTKKCTKCGEEKDLSGFSRDKNKKDGFSSQCKKCVSDYYKKNKEKLIANQKAYYENNKEKLAKRQQAYLKANRKKVSSLHKAYYEKNREKMMASQKDYREANKEKLSALHKDYFEKNKEKINKTRRAYYKANKEKIRKNHKAWKEEKKLLEKDIE